MHGWLSDVRLAIRRLAHSPGFTVAVALTLALGVGVNAAVFSVVRGVLLRPLPFDEPERLVFITREGDVGLPDGEDWREQSRTLASIALFLPSYALNLTGDGEPERLRSSVVEPEYFDVLGMPPLLGRTLVASDDAKGAEPVVVLSESFWKRRFGGDPGVLGRLLTLSDVPAKVVGVMPAGFDLLDARVDLWIAPTVATPWALGNRGSNNFDAIGRLAPGATVEQAREEMVAISHRLEKLYPRTNEGKIVEPKPLLDFIVGDVERSLVVLMAAVGLLLLATCVNLAALLLARITGRQEELAVRQSLGATGARIARMLLVEGMVLGVLGGGLGTLAAYASQDALVAMAPDSLPRLSSVRVDGGVLAFGMSLSAAVGLLVCLLPAFQAARRDPADCLRGAGRGTADRRRHRLLGVLTVSEIALAFALAMGSGLLVRTFVSLHDADLGFDSDGLVTAQLVLPESRYGTRDAQTRVFRDLVEALDARPEVVSAAYVITPPLEPRGGIGGALLVQEPGVEADRFGARARFVHGDYFGTIGLRVLDGRPLGPGDEAGTAPVAVVNESLAHSLWPGQRAVGKRIAWRDWNDGEPTWMEVVGVAADVKGVGIQQPDDDAVYLPYVQRQADWMRWGTLVARTRTRPSAFVPTLRRVVWSVEPTLPVSQVETIEQRRDGQIAQQRFSAAAVSMFSALALLVALQGVYALLSFAVEQRRHELGVRLALGARAGDLVRLVLSRGLRVVAAGILLGALGALGAGRLISGLLYGVAPSDPATLAVVGSLLLATALAACYLPARRASRVDPAVTLRE